MPMFLIFLILPFAELIVFGMISDDFGFWTALCLCALTAIIGSALVRQQGLRTFFALQAALEQGKMPLTEIFDGFCQMAAGVLLITPGFITDAIGFLLLVPQVRSFLRAYIKTHTQWEMTSGAAEFTHTYRRGDPDIIEGEFTRIDADDKLEGGDKTP